MANRNDFQNEITKLSKASTTMLLDNVLSKHNVKLTNKNISRSEKEKIRNLVNDLQASFQKLQKQNK